MRTRIGLPKVEPVILALVLNREARTERVVVGEEESVRLRLEGKSEYGQILFDQVRPLGTLILDHEVQNGGDWNARVIFPLSRALRSKKNRKENEQEAWSAVKEAMESNNPVTIFTACNLMALYCPEMCNKSLVADILEGKMLTLTRPYSRKLLVTRNKNVIEGAVENSREMLQSASMKMDANDLSWHPWKDCRLQCTVSRENMLPQVYTYLMQLLEWECGFTRCEICDRPFAAFSGHYVYCGMKECEVIRNRRNKKANYERAKDNQYDKLYADTRDGIRRKIKKLKEQSNVSQELIEEAEEWYERFREEGKRRKNSLKKNSDEIKIFCDWLFAQQRIFDELFVKRFGRAQP